MQNEPYKSLGKRSHDATLRLLVSLALILFGGRASGTELLVTAFGQIGPTWDRGIAAFDAQNGYQSCFNDLGAACPNVNWKWLTADGDSFIRLEYPGTKQLAAVYFKASIPQDFTVFTGGVIEITARASAPDTSLTIKVDCDHPCGTTDIRLSQRLDPEWRLITVEVDMLIERGLDISSVDTGLVLWPSDLALVDIDIKNIVWRMTADAAAQQRGTGGPVLLLENLEDTGNSSATDYDGLTLVWGDEFEQSEIDLGSWNFDVGGGGWGNNEWQYYQPDNAAITDGHLVITAREQRVENRNYTSSRIKTEDEMEFTYGRVDIRAALPKGQGIWPALWSLGANFRDVGWPYTGELDIMEMIGGSGREDTIHGTLHWNIGGLNSPYAHRYEGGAYNLPSGEFSDGFHVFSMIREPGQVRWLVDDVPYYSFSLSNAPDFDAFRLPFFLIFNVAVGGRWPGYPDESTAFPQRLVVDYVRIFINKTATEDSDGDGVIDPDDDLPLDPEETRDLDGDGIGNSADTDDDGDGYSDEDEASAGTDPLDADSYPKTPDEETGGLPIWMLYTATKIAAEDSQTVSPPTISKCGEDIFGRLDCDELSAISLPYSSSGSQSTSRSPKPAYFTFGTYILSAELDDYRVAELIALDRNGRVSPEIKDLSEAQVISQGQSVQFEVRTPPTNGQQTDLRFYLRFEGGSGQACDNCTFSFERVFTSN